MSLKLFDLKQHINDYIPLNEQEAQDQKVILQFMDQFENVLERSNEYAHITSSAFIVNENCNKALMIHHNIMKKWAWTGGHADGDSDLLAVALKEAKEETGVINIKPLTNQIASIDILPVRCHEKKNHYINTHLHLSIAYLLECDENQSLHICQDENSGVEWVDFDKINDEHFCEYDVYLYTKLINKAKLLKGKEVDYGD